MDYKFLYFILFLISANVVALIFGPYDGIGNYIEGVKAIYRLQIRTAIGRKERAVARYRLICAYALDLFASIVLLATMLTTLIDGVYLVGVLGNYVISNINSPILIPFFLLSGFFLYGLRSRLPFVYGSFELIVGVSTVYYTTTNSSSTSSGLSKLLALLSGIYIMVRGLDNIDKQVPPRIQTFWDILKWKSRARQGR